MKQTCERCGEKLKEGVEVWLELDTRTNTYTSNTVPDEHSQGSFAFGRRCAKLAQAKHDAATSNVGVRSHLWRTV